ncbi:TPA: integrase, partial [Acinetobacter baumannii]|nr:integrase [Acinetobacter baumannii]
INHHELKERTLADYREVIEKYLIDLSELKLIDITEQRIEERYTQLSQYSYAKANLSMRVLRAVYRFSIKYYQNKNCEVIIPRINPVNLLKKKQLWEEIPPRRNYIDVDNLTKWVQAIIEYKGRGQENETNKDFLLTLILTGLFRNECESLHWKNIDLE